MTGLVPADVWRSSFGVDRAGLIGHKLDPKKWVAVFVICALLKKTFNRLEAKIPKNMASLERDLSILEPLFAQNKLQSEKWMLGTPTPGAADVNLYFMFKWGRDIARGIGVNNLTGGELPDMVLKGIEDLFSERRFPGVWRWYEDIEEYWNGLPSVETELIEDGDRSGVESVLNDLNVVEDHELAIPMLPTPQPWNKFLDEKSGLTVGAEVSIAPDDTGRDDPVVGTLVKLSAEEVVVRPAELERGSPPTVGGARIHFPRVGFVFRQIP